MSENLENTATAIENQNISVNMPTESVPEPNMSTESNVESNAENEMSTESVANNMSTESIAEPVYENSISTESAPENSISAEPAPENSMSTEPSLTRKKQVRSTKQKEADAGQAKMLERLRKLYDEEFADIPERSRPKAKAAVCFRFGILARAQGTTVSLNINGHLNRKGKAKGKAKANATAGSRSGSLAP